MSETFCQATKAGPKLWRCEACGHESPGRFIGRRCGARPKPEAPAPKRFEVMPARTTPEERLTIRLDRWRRVPTRDRTRDEVEALLDVCRDCEFFTGENCRRDSGCDRFAVFGMRLFFRSCERWAGIIQANPDKNAAGISDLPEPASLPESEPRSGGDFENS